MKNIINKLNKIFDSRMRLGIMSILIVNDWIEFKIMKEMLDASDGNLASHIKALEKNEYIDVRKRFVGKKPQTSYRITKLGKKAFKEHLNALEELLNNNT